MRTELMEIIRKSTFSVEHGVYVYAKVHSIPENDKHFFVSKDQDEITVVTKQEHVSDLSLIERNKDDYALIALNVSIPFYCVGFLAEVTKVLAEKGMNVLIVSTYSKDYVLVKHENAQKAAQALLDLGFAKK